MWDYLISPEDEKEIAKELTAMEDDSENKRDLLHILQVLHQKKRHKSAPQINAISRRAGVPLQALGSVNCATCGADTARNQMCPSRSLSDSTGTFTETS